MIGLCSLLLRLTGRFGVWLLLVAGLAPAARAEGAACSDLLALDRLIGPAMLAPAAGAGTPAQVPPTVMPSPDAILAAQLLFLAQVEQGLPTGPTLLTAAEWRRAAHWLQGQLVLRDCLPGLPQLADASPGVAEAPVIGRQTGFSLPRLGDWALDIPTAQVRVAGMLVLMVGLSILLGRRTLRRKRREDETRYICDLEGRLLGPQAEVAVRVLDLSRSGCKISLPHGTRAEGDLRMAIGDWSVHARKAWRNNHYLGLWFDTRMSEGQLHALLHGPAPAALVAGTDVEEVA